MSEELKEITRLCGVIKEKDKENRRLYIALRNREQEIERLNNIINEVSKELKEFNESYLEDEGDTGVYRYLNKLIEKLNEGE